MKWIKKGLIFKTDGIKAWSRTHAQVPFALPLGKDILRIYYATRDAKSRSSVSYIETDINDPAKILYEHPDVCLGPGADGDFDDCGAMPSWFVVQGNQIWLYYTGWNMSKSGYYHLSIGLAVSEDGGITFRKRFLGPIMDRCTNDPIWVAQPCVLRENRKWKMWYLSCEKMQTINGRLEPFYNVKYATSRNGIDWTRSGKVCIGFSEDTDAIGRPCVYKENGVYKMLHSNRRAKGYRKQSDKGYRICFSESSDGIHWKRIDNGKWIPKTKASWDSVMAEYCSVYQHNGVRYLVYNGNGFGKSGFGYATSLVKSKAKREKIYSYRLS